VSQRLILIPYLLLLAFFGGVVGLRLGEWYVMQDFVQELRPPMQEFSQYALTLMGSLVGLLTASLSFSKFQRILGGVEKAPFSDKVAGGVGLLFGAIVGAALVAPLREMPVGLKAALLVLSSLLGVSFGLSMKDEIASWFGQAPASTSAKGQTAPMGADAPSDVAPKLLDTNVIIDGRIADICTTGFVEGPLMVPQFVLQELQSIADSESSLRRARGRRGLVMLARMQKELGDRVQVTEDYDIELDYRDPVDVRLVRLGKAMNAYILTNDFNLNKVAELQGIKILNVNELANALKPVVLPGELMVVKVIKEGKEPGQGVAYLDDGTMVIVDHASRHLGETLEVAVTSVLQTTAGRMIFTELKAVVPDKKYHSVEAL